jgi:hypothetical protein
MAIADPGTIDDLIADAARAGYPITARLIRDWTQIGLLDHPRRRPAGRGRGSSPALYPANQRELLLTLLSKRADNGIGSLARIPVGIWMYWGDIYVPLHQARQALLTWIGTPRASQRGARETAQAVLGQLDNSAATPAARRELRNVLTNIAYTRKLDPDQLERAVFDVFEPSVGPVRRVVGHHEAPLMADSVIDVMKARLTAVAHLMGDQVSDETFYQARRFHLVAYAEYAVKQPALARSGAVQNSGMYEAVTAERALNDCCVHLLTTIGLEIMNPQRAVQLGAQAGPGDARSVSPAARHAILGPGS